MKLNDRELAAVLCGLRLVQRHFAGTGFTSSQLEILTNGEAFRAMEVGEIDALCERLNTEPDETYKIEHASDETDRIKCLRCGSTSANQGDVLMRYCAMCDWMHEEHRPRDFSDVKRHREFMERGRAWRPADGRMRGGQEND